ncbi:uncharacterized protein [Dermacentor albipictus]|uniref:uncharacterized protein isoform X2 n=1 Tax=Dermacentor albipictus TaxID=60249 RepID=UPI0031FD1511
MRCLLPVTRSLALFICASFHGNARSMCLTDSAATADSAESEPRPWIIDNLDTRNHGETTPWEDPLKIAKCAAQTNVVHRHLKRGHKGVVQPEAQLNDGRYGGGADITSEQAGSTTWQQRHPLFITQEGSYKDTKMSKSQCSATSRSAQERMPKNQETLPCNLDKKTRMWVYWVCHLTKCQQNQNTVCHT